MSMNEDAIELKWNNIMMMIVIIYDTDMHKLWYIYEYTWIPSWYTQHGMTAVQTAFQANKNSNWMQSI